MATHVNMLHVDWAISRMRRLFEIWDSKLAWCDKAYCLRRIRDREPALFYSVANERAGRG
jgi:hypothetical protein